MKFLESISSDFPVGNAAGWCKSLEEVERVAASAAQFIVVGSITVEARPGNPGNTFDGVSLNSLGLPNPGIKKIVELAPRMTGVAHAAKKPIILSIAGFTPTEYVGLAQAALMASFDGVEISLGCPNVADDGKRKPIASFDLRLIEKIVRSSLVVTPRSPDFFVSVKVSPMSNPLQIIETASLLGSCGIDAIVTMNTFPNGLLYNENGTPVIQTPDRTGWAGFAGSTVKPMALGQVNQWRKALDFFDKEHVRVIGVGGVEDGCDVRDMQRAGATLVQVGTAYFVGGARIFGDIANEFINLA